MECEYCHAKFTTKPNLLRHQRTVLACVGKRTFSCDGCARTFDRKSNLKRHYSKCGGFHLKKQLDEVTEKVIETSKELDNVKMENIKYKNINQQQKERITELETSSKIYKEEAAKPKYVIINNKTYNFTCDTIAPFTVETVRAELGKGVYDFERFKRRENGIAEFIKGIVLEETVDANGKITQRSYNCSDNSRNSFHRLVETRQWIKDHGGAFIEVVLDELRPSAQKFIDEIDQKIKTTKSVIERDSQEYLRDYLKSTFYGIIDTDTKYRKNLFNKVRLLTRKFTSV